MPALPQPDDGPPRTLGRYVVLSSLHHGAAADVYLAYDPELGRKLVVKLLSSERSREPGLVLGQRPHPQLVTIHDTGNLGARRFIAMEHISGGTLTAWLDETPHTWRMLARRFVEIWAGLCAAHAQGLAHRGLDSDAVVVDEAGRAFVLGFCRPAGAEAHAAAVDRDLRAFVLLLCKALSQQPRIAGMPSYVQRLTQRLLRRPAEPLLSPADFAQLLAVLRRPPPARIPFLVAACALFLPAAWLGRQLVQPPAARCQSAEFLLAPLIDAARSEAMRSAFLRTGKPFAADAFVGVRRALDSYLPHWRALYESTCRDAGQSALDRDLRMACLEQQRQRLDQLLTVLGSADERIVPRAVSLASELTDLASVESCRDAGGLRAQTPQPTEPAARAAVTNIRAELARIDTLHRAGLYAEGARLTQKLTARAEALAYRPLLAEVYLQEGIYTAMMGNQEAGRQQLLRSIWAAEASHHDRAAAQAWLQLFSHATERLHDVPLGAEYARHAAAALTRCTSCSELWMKWHQLMGTLLHYEGRLDQALIYHQESLRQRLLRLPAQSLETAHSYHSLGNLYAEMERRAAARKSVLAALRILEYNLGPRHPAVASALISLSVIERKQGLLTEALQHCERGLEVFAEVFGETHFSVAAHLNVLADILMALGREEAARAALQRALALVPRTLGSGHSAVSSVHNGMGQLALRQGRPAEARARFAAALENLMKSRPPHHLEQIFPRVGLSRAYSALGQSALALTTAARALAIYAEIPPSVEALAGVHFALAVARWTHPATRRQAHALAEQAQAAYTELGPGFTRERAEVAAWLRAHPFRQ